MSPRSIWGLLWVGFAVGCYLTGQEMIDENIQRVIWGGSPNNPQLKAAKSAVNTGELLRVVSFVAGAIGVVLFAMGLNKSEER